MGEMDGALRVGVIGVGHLGATHVRLWKGADGAMLSGIFDTDADRAREIATEHGVAVYPTVDELLASVDAVSIVTPTSTHAEVAQRALEAGVHCFIEKPITSRYAEAQRLIELADRRGLVLQVGHVERFNPAFLALSTAMVEPMFIESHRLAQFRPRATDVAVVLDLMIHDLDLVLHLVRSEAVEIRASGVAVVSDTIDIANARVEFANGCVANLTASRISQRPMRKMRLFQRDAYISLDFAKPGVEIFRITDEGEELDGSTMLLGAIEQGTQRRKITYEQPALSEVNAIAKELAEFTDAIRTGMPPPVTAHDGAEALRIAEAIIEAIEAKMPVPARGGE